ncbi:MAG: hypothetical protein HOF61_04040 [Verrucomicrobia bacterium]|nr:hypothetical protein [Verrucomicrobiota bacterium]
MKLSVWMIIRHSLLRNHHHHHSHRNYLHYCIRYCIRHQRIHRFRLYLLAHLQLLQK